MIVSETGMNFVEEEGLMALKEGEFRTPPSGGGGEVEVEAGSRYFVNTNGTCFLCLQQTSSLSSGFYSYKNVDGYEEEEREVDGCEVALKVKVEGERRREGLEEELEFCHWNIFRYLGITPGSIGKRLEEEIGGDHWDFSVPICGECSTVASRMSRLCQELELIQRQLECCVDTVKNIISCSDNDPGKMEEFSRRLMKSSVEGEGEELEEKEGILNRTVVNLLRKETKEKCIQRLRKRRPSKDNRLKSCVEEEPEGPEVSHQIENDSNNILAVTEPTALNSTAIKIEENKDILVLKEDYHLSSSSSPPLRIQDLQTEWPGNCVPEMDQEISIGICEEALPLPPPPPPTTTESDHDLGFQLEQIPIPSLPPVLEAQQLEEEMSPLVIKTVTSFCAGLQHQLGSSFKDGELPPPPPPVNIPPKTKKPKKKKRPSSSSSSLQLDSGYGAGGDLNLNTTCNGIGGTLECPVDFYFHKKKDNRHLCPFCSDTSPTLTNLRFHVIRAHPEELFSTSRLLHHPQSDFKATCELMLFTVTKEAETGDRNPSGTKVVVKCNFCSGTGEGTGTELEETPPKIYHDKRAFQCHLILNHYEMLSQRLQELQRFNGKGEIASAAAKVYPPTPPVLTPSLLLEGTSSSNSSTESGKKGNKRSWVYRLNAKNHDEMLPKKRKREETTPKDGGNLVCSESATPPSTKIVNSFICEHCGKSLSSSTSKWRHKQLYCEVLRNRGELGGGKASSTSPLPPSVDTDSGLSGTSTISRASSPASASGLGPSHIYLMDRGGGDGGDGGGLDHVDGGVYNFNFNDFGGGDHDMMNQEKTGLELLLQQANDMIMKEENGGDGDGGRCGGDSMEEYEHFVSEFQEFYDEDEVNDALLTMMMENVPGNGGGGSSELGEIQEEDPLQI